MLGTWYVLLLLESNSEYPQHTQRWILETGICHFSSTLRIENLGEPWEESHADEYSAVRIEISDCSYMSVCGTRSMQDV